MKSSERASAIPFRSVDLGGKSSPPSSAAPSFPLGMKRELPSPDTPTPKAQEGTWMLTAPDGRTWQADSPLKVCGIEQRERVPAGVALARIYRELDDTPQCDGEDSYE